MLSSQENLYFSLLQVPYFYFYKGNSGFLGSWNKALLSLVAYEWLTMGALFFSILSGKQVTYDCVCICQAFGIEAGL